MDDTRNPELNPDIFAERTEQFFTNYQLPHFTNPEEAVSFINVGDTLVDAISETMQKLEMSYTPETILIFGSPLGEALRMIFSADWKFSETQNRWVIAVATPSGDLVELNIFNKLEKRIENGMEDSLSYFLQGTAKLFT